MQRQHLSSICHNKSWFEWKLCYALSFKRRVGYPRHIDCRRFLEKPNNAHSRLNQWLREREGYLHMKHEQSHYSFSRKQLINAWTLPIAGQRKTTLPQSRGGHNKGQKNKRRHLKTTFRLFRSLLYKCRCQKLSELIVILVVPDFNLWKTPPHGNTSHPLYLISLALFLCKQTCHHW